MCCGIAGVFVAASGGLARGFQHLRASQGQSGLIKLIVVFISKPGSLMRDVAGLHPTARNDTNLSRDEAGSRLPPG